MNTYSSAQRTYTRFCSTYNLPPIPLTERFACLFVAHLAERGLCPQSISAYMAGVRHLQITAGMTTPQRQEWPRLQLVMRGIRQSQAATPRKTRLPITFAIMKQVQSALPLQVDTFTAKLLWAACCTGFFGFMRCGEFTLVRQSDSPPIAFSDIVLDSHTSPTVVRICLRWAKCDPFGQGIFIYLGKTASSVCPVAALVDYLAIRPNHAGSLFTWHDGSPLCRYNFVARLRRVLATFIPDANDYSGHSFRIGAATTAALASVPDHIIKMMGRWQSEAYTLYVRQSRESLASISNTLTSSSSVSRQV